MKSLAQSAVIAALAKDLRRKGSWCGETHIQKATYFLKEMLHVPVESQFILYKHGPFSFDLRQDLTQMRAKGLMRLVPESYYGPRLEVTDAGDRLISNFPKTLKKYGPRIAFISDELSGDGVATLEQVATALYVSRNWSSLGKEKQIDQMIELKPHIAAEEGEAAFERLRLIEECASKVGVLEVSTA